MKGVMLSPNITISPSNASNPYWYIQWVGAPNASVLTMPTTWTFDAVGAGTARIAVISSYNYWIRDTITVTVVQGVDSLSVANHSKKIGDADYAPSITWMPANATNKGYVLSQGAAGVATVVSNRVHLEGPGTAVFKVTANDGGKTAFFNVTVVVPVTDLICDDFVMRMGDPDRAPPMTWVPADATNKGYTMTSSSPDNAAVVDGTKIRAVSRGYSNLVVTSNDGNIQGTCIVEIRSSFEF
jgi:hypothetical protein